MTTNDGGTILTDLGDLFESNLAQFALRSGKTLSKTEGDGIKTFYIVLAEFLRIAHELDQEGIPRAALIDALEWIHQIWEKFTQLSQFQVDANLNSCPPPTISEYLQSTLSGKLSPANAAHLASIAAAALNRMGDLSRQPWIDIAHHFQVELLPGTSIIDSALLDGVLIGKLPDNAFFVPPEGIVKPRILLIRQKLYFDLPDKGESSPGGIKMEIRLSYPQDVTALRAQKEKIVNSWLNHLGKHAPAVIITEKGVDSRLEALLNSHRILVVRRAKPAQFEYLMRYLHIDPVDNIESISPQQVAVAERIYLKKIGRDMQVVISNQTSAGNHALSVTQKNNSIGTLLVGGIIWYVCQEAERMLGKLILAGAAFLKDRQIFLGGGNVELLFYQELRQKIHQASPKIAYAIGQLSQAFLAIPNLLLESCGMEPLEGIATLKSAIAQGNGSIGVDVNRQTLGNMAISKIYDNYPAKVILYRTLISTAQQLLRVDRIFNYKRVAKEESHHDH